MTDQPQFAPGERIAHAEFGAGVVLDAPREGYLRAFFSVGDTHLELLEPMEPDTVIGRFIAQRKGGIHHICFEVEDLDLALEEYRQRGVRLIDQTPRNGAKGCRVAFVHPSAAGGVLIELSEKPK